MFKDILTEDAFREAYMEGLKHGIEAIKQDNPPRDVVALCNAIVMPSTMEMVSHIAYGAYLHRKLLARSVSRAICNQLLEIK